MAADIDPEHRSSQNGDPHSTEQLFILVYDELRKLAAVRLAREGPGQTLQTTALVHEVYLRLASGGRANEWNGQHHFFAAAAEAMRRILIERARRKATLKEGGTWRQVDLDDPRLDEIQRCNKMLAIDAALRDLEGHDALAAQIVKLRYFVGMSHQEAADAMQISRRTADRTWALAKAWLYRHLTSD